MMGSLNDLMGFANKSYGRGTVITGNELKRDPPRLPFGVFAIDFALGGGLPLYGTACLWGDESAGKTSLGINALASSERICWRCFNYLSKCVCSKSALKMGAFWADSEGTFDRDWATNIGADPKKYYYALADYGEMYVNLADSALQSDDCGLIVLDSLAALIPVAELDAAMEDQFMGNQAKLITRCVRKLRARINKERKNEHPCAVLFTNQMRKRIGMMFGDPSTMPGGHALRHEFSLLLRMTKKALNESDKTKYIDKKMGKERASRHSFAIKKEKVLTLSGSGEYVRIKSAIKDRGLEVGQIDDYNTVMNYAKEYDLLRKDRGRWKMPGKSASKLEDVKAYWKKFPVEYAIMQMEILSRAKKRLGWGI